MKAEEYNILDLREGKILQTVIAVSKRDALDNYCRLHGYVDFSHYLKYKGVSLEDSPLVAHPNLALVSIKPPPPTEYPDIKTYRPALYMWYVIACLCLLSVGIAFTMSIS